ncbi:hypothetical protein [Streptomyces nogalater]|uniref:Uncharacterized protein n=1 Tax=Streptomyces nogalater TaxID=38314 RepID=A0ABW0WLE4_STRNO
MIIHPRMIALVCGQVLNWPSEALSHNGVHVFTGVADSPAEALRRAHEVYATALAARSAGREIPGKQPDQWGARGLRPVWELEWPAATAGL